MKSVGHALLRAQKISPVLLLSAGLVGTALSLIGYAASASAAGDPTRELILPTYTTPLNAGSSIAMDTPAYSPSVQNCAECQARIRQAMISPLSAPVLSNAQLPGTVDQIVNHPSLLRFPTLPASSSPLTVDAQGNWLNEFKRPWTFAETDFDPSFRTPYWNETDGVINSPFAPWNQGLAAPFGDYLYQQGMLYVGKGSYAPLAPVFTQRTQVAPPEG